MTYFSSNSNGLPQVVRDLSGREIGQVDQFGNLRGAYGQTTYPLQRVDAFGNVSGLSGSPSGVYIDSLGIARNRNW